MRSRLLLAATLALLVLSGCSQPADDDDGSSTTATPAAPTDSSYTITLSDFPVAPLEAGAQFHFNSTIAGNTTRTSDHIGAHFGNKSTEAPSTAVYNVICVHTVGQLPGKYMVTCTAPQQPGVYYLRGHARITTADSLQVNWWSSEATFTVAPLQGNLQG